ncbi:microphthalmia-associated transcription factor-like [Tropilaelaps mercedesae]|uniref:Microphthalmia-associated transcription factor-like n=1 Tax=Tropilaelaps mercedesae TaxID=418985 RepID=A0A1V9XAW4_9ACAR|nr:microphthalmia-associated transcription factor-like [Tropilaelaps mercedesae]
MSAASSKFYIPNSSTTGQTLFHFTRKGLSIDTGRCVMLVGLNISFDDVLDGLSQLTNGDDFSLFELPPTVSSGTVQTPTEAPPAPATHSGSDLSPGTVDSLPSAAEMDDMWSPPLASSCPAELTSMVKSESSSCEFFTENDLKALAKDRQKKDNHNMTTTHRQAQLASVSLSGIRRTLRCFALFPENRMSMELLLFGCPRASDDGSFKRGKPNSEKEGDACTSCVWHRLECLQALPVMV